MSPFLKLSLALAIYAVVVPTPAIGEPQSTPAGAQEQEIDRVEVTLLDAIEFALRQNLRIRVSRLGRDISREGVARAQGQFDPQLTFDVPQFFSHNTTPQASQIEGAIVSVTENFGGGFRFDERLKWGTQWSVAWAGSRGVSNSDFQTVNPRLQSNLAFNITQPLLRGRGSEIATQQVLIAEIDVVRNDEQFRQDVQQVVLDTYRSYWNLLLRYRQRQVRVDAQELSRQQLERTGIRQQLGTVRPIDVVQSETRLADDEVLLLQAEMSLEEAQDAFKRLINVDAMGQALWRAEFVPVDEPETEPGAVDVDDETRVALERDPVLAQLRIDVDRLGIQVRGARNEMLPSLDVTGFLRLDGQGGNNIVRSRELGGAVREIQANGFPKALQQLFSGDFRSWSVGLRLTMPVRNTQARATHAQTLLQQKQAVFRVQDREQELRVLVNTVVRRFDSLRDQLRAATTSRVATERQLALAQGQVDLGTADLFQLLQFQVDLTNAQSRELQLVVDLTNAFADLEATKGTLLEALGVRLSDAGR